jgi:hypothetical protein
MKKAQEDGFILMIIVLVIMILAMVGIAFVRVQRATQ